MSILVSWNKKKINSVVKSVTFVKTNGWAKHVVKVKKK